MANTCDMSKAVGGLSACLVRYLKKHLLGPLGVQTVGVVCNVDGVSYTLYARLTNLLSDGEGLKYGLDVFGHGGIAPCIRCWNVLRKTLALPIAATALLRLDAARAGDSTYESKWVWLMT